ncbi:hypothetical protein AB0D66_32580 [Streptomyces sp. NPDC048270]|uniref:hypothetical protein n=1 Tax=Streptomyces sp. NPDC048270 TaxID=3154615 RepID=UPI0033D6006E
MAGPRVQPGGNHNDTGLLERTLTALGRPAWEATPEDIDRVVGDLVVQGRKTSIRREYVQIFKGFHRFLQARKSVEIEAAFSVRWSARSTSSMLQGMSGMVRRPCCRPSFGKGIHTSGPRPRWVPMLDNLDLVLRWFLEDVRPKFPDSPVLFADESGGSLHCGTICNRLRYLMELEGRPAAERFSPHALRSRCCSERDGWGSAGGSG